MHEIYEITPFDFIEFLKDKKLISEGAAAYEFLTKHIAKTGTANIEKSINDAMEELRSVELNSTRQGLIHSRSVNEMKNSEIFNISHEK